MMNLELNMLLGLKNPNPEQVSGTCKYPYILMVFRLTVGIPDEITACVF